MKRHALFVPRGRELLSAWTLWVGALVLAVLLAFASATAAQAAALTPDDPAALKQTRSLGRVIQDTPGRPVHIVFVHGIRADGPGTAQTFMTGLCAHVPVRCPPKTTGGAFQASERKPLDVGPMPTATVAGQPIWTTAKAWTGSQPFVDRYVFERPGGRPPVVVDEVNWWPLLFPLKCQMLVGPDAYLSGVDKSDLALCHRDDPPYYPWLDEAQYKKALAGPGVSRGGAWANAWLKQNIMNWGFADAVIALGPMRTYTRAALDGAFEYATEFQDQGVAGQEFVVVSESLGSFVVMDAAGSTAGAKNVRNVVLNTADLYFFANQFALLDLARIHGVPITSDQGAKFAAILPGPVDPSALSVLQEWAASPTRPRQNGLALEAAPPVIKQIIAFSDPSDVLTFKVPKLPPAIVVNVYDRNAFDWFGLVVLDPGKAHIGHSANPAVLKMMFSPGGGLQR